MTSTGSASEGLAVNSVGAQPGNSLQRGVLFSFLATLAWSTTGIFIDQLVTVYHLTPLEISAWRALLGGAVMGGFLRWRDPASLQLSRREVPFLALYGVIGIALFNVVWSTSVEVNKAAVATALIFSAPVFVAIGARLIFKEIIRGIQVAAIVVNLLGCALVSGVYDPAALLQNPAGMLLGLASGLFFGSSTLFGKGAVRLSYHSSAAITFFIFSFGAIALLLVGFVLEGLNILFLPLDLWGWLLLIGLSVGPTLLGYLFFNVSLQYLPAALVSLLTTMEPPITAILALIFLGRSMNGLQWLGTGLIVGGVVIMQLVTANFKRSLKKPELSN
ncbi:MAG TPA: EamA family transporter [Chloroflexia bacterium]|nr:EamA family transporter [Chloroflexia bacterium]